MTRKWAHEQRGPHRETPLQRYFDANDIASARVEAKLAERLKGQAPSRNKMIRWRLGRSEPRRKDMVHLLWAVREVSGNPTIRVEELFDFDTENPANW